MPTPLDRTAWTALSGINGAGAFGNVKDSDLGTNWNNGGSFQAIGSIFGWDMGSLQSFGTLRVYQNAPEWEIHISDDGAAWTLLEASVLGGGSDTAVETNVDFGAEITCRYVRFTLLDTDSFHYKIWEVDLFVYEPPPPPPIQPAGTRQFQEDFETATHGLNGTSTTRRPDAISLDYQVAYSSGPVAIEDTSQGVEAWAWYVRVEGQVLYICRENDARDDWGPEEVLHDFAYSGSSLMDEIDFCFDLDGKPVVVAERLSGTGGTTPEIWIYRWVDAFSDYILSGFGAGRTPRCVLDLFPESLDPDVCPPEVNVQVLYFEPDEFLTRLQQSDLFATKYVTEVATLPTRYLEEVFPTDGRRLGAYWVEHDEVAGTYAENFHWTVPYPNGELHEPVFEGVVNDLVWLRGEPWRNPSGSVTTQTFFWRVKTRDPCDAIEIQCANSFPSGFQPHTGGIWTEQVTDSIAEGYPSLDAEDFVDFNIDVTHGMGTMSPNAFRARTRKTVGAVTCYSPWRYYFAAREAIAGEFTDPNYTLYNCDHDAVICWNPEIDPWFYEYGVDDRGCNPCIGQPAVCSAACAPEGFFVGGWQPDSPFTWRRDWSLQVRSRYIMAFSDPHQSYGYTLLGKVFHTETEGAGVALSPSDITPLTVPSQIAGIGETLVFPGWEPLGTVVDEIPTERPLPVVHEASWFDPSSLNGQGATLPSVVLDLEESTVVVRARGETIEALFTQANVFGVALLDSFVFLPVCTKLLRVYDDDGSTILWEVSTAASHPRPHLVEPDRYQEQEIDVAEGAATLGTVSVTVIDPPTIAGDQDSGEMTRRLANLGVADLAGHRCELLIFVSEEIGYQVIIDGPAGVVRMDPSYAAFSWDIRDTRETERKLRIFQTTVLSLIPDEIPLGYWPDPTGGEPVVPPARALRGRFAPSGITGGAIHVGLSEFPLNGRRIVITREAYDAIINGLPRVGGPADFGGLTSEQLLVPGETMQFRLRWRFEGTFADWTEIPGRYLHVNLSTAASTILASGYVIGQVIWTDRRLDPSSPDYDPAAPGVPEDPLFPGADVDVEFFLEGPIAPDERHPAIVEDIGLGDVVYLPNLAGTLVLGEFAFGSSAGGYTDGLVDLTANPGNAAALRTVSRRIFDALDWESTVLLDFFRFESGTLRWRAAGSSDPWTSIPLTPTGAYIELQVAPPFDFWDVVFMTLALHVPDAQAPADTAAIEFILEVIPPADLRVTTGQFLKNVYDGLYSARDPLTGAIVPSGVRYDEAALLLMDDRVHLRLTEPVEDARDWTEKHIYAATGWIPALDMQGLISPVSQIAPQVGDVTELVNDAITEPSSEWDSGERIVNVLRFTYPRDFNAGAPDPPIAGGEDRQPDIGSREILLEYREESSITRYGEHVLDMSGIAFSTRGLAAEEIDTSGTLEELWYLQQQRISQFLRRPFPGSDPAESADPNAGNPWPGIPLEQEQGYLLFTLRVLHVLNRYKFGAPAFRAAVMRSGIPTVRPGSWVVVNLSWLPDYSTQRRGLQHLAQVIAIDELDCAWRRLLMEMVVPVLPGS